jgi:hypothetical protein
VPKKLLLTLDFTFSTKLFAGIQEDKHRERFIPKPIRIALQTKVFFNQTFGYNNKKFYICQKLILR